MLSLKDKLLAEEQELEQKRKALEDEEDVEGLEEKEIRKVEVKMKKKKK